MMICKNQTALQKQKMGLFEKLWAKLQIRKEADANKTKDQVPNPDPTKKRGRAGHCKFEIEWLCSENGQAKQIREEQGGGTRTLVVGVECGMDTVQKRK